MTHATRSNPRIDLEATRENINILQRFLTSQNQSNIISAINNACLQGEDIQGGPWLQPILPLGVMFLHFPGLGDRFISPILMARKLFAELSPLGVFWVKNRAFSLPAQCLEVLGGVRCGVPREA